MNTTQSKITPEMTAAAAKLDAAYRSAIAAGFEDLDEDYGIAMAQDEFLSALDLASDDGVHASGTVTVAA